MEAQEARVRTPPAPERLVEKIVIIGAGQAGMQIAASLRQAGFEGKVTLLGAEAEPPYQRPPLSKAYLQGALERDRLWLRPLEFYEKSKIDLRLGARATAIDRDRCEVALESGERIPYDQLAIATGAPPRRLPIPGADLPGVHYLRTMDDSDRIRPSLESQGRVAIIGAGYIGLEVAASARKAGREVVVLEALERPLARVAGKEVAEFFVDLHRRHGVEFRFGARVKEIIGSARVEGVALQTGDEVPCGTVLIGIGAAPDIAIAEAAGLEVGNGILVDDRARTSDPAIFSAGDCANFPSTLYARRMRLESQPNAIDQAKVAGSVMAGRDAVYDPAPWFWSDQYDIKLQTAGICEGADQNVVRRSPSAVSVWYLKAGRLIAVDAMNDVPAFAISRRLIAAKAEPDPKILADPGRDLKSLIS